MPNLLNPYSINQSAGKTQTDTLEANTDRSGNAPNISKTRRWKATGIRLFPWPLSAHSPRQAKFGSAEKIRRGECGESERNVHTGAFQDGFAAPGQTKWRLRNVASSASRLHLRGF